MRFGIFKQANLIFFWRVCISALISLSAGATTVPNKYKYSNFMKWQEIPHFMNTDIGLVNALDPKELQVMTVTTFPIRLRSGEEVSFFRKNLEKMAKTRGRSQFAVEKIETLPNRRSKAYAANVTYSKEGVARREAFVMVPNRNEIYVLHYGSTTSRFEIAENTFKKWVQSFEIQ